MKTFPDRRRALVGISAAAAATACPSLLVAQPAGRPVRMVIPYPPGPPDTFGRLFADKLSPRLSASVIVENKAGAAGGVGADLVARAAPDGSTLLFAAGSLVGSNPFVFTKLMYSPDQFTPIGLASEVNFVLTARPGMGVRTVSALVELMKKEAGRIIYPNGGPGSLPHLAFADFAHRAGVRYNDVPVRGGNAVLAAALGGNADVFVGVASETLSQYFTEGKLVPLAVFSGSRLPQMPAVPTMAESGFPEVALHGYYGLFGPRDMPPGVLKRLSEAVVEVTADPAYRARLASLHAAPGSVADAAAFARYVKADQTVWSGIAARTGIRITE